jgi:hypothetical protein
MSEGMRVTKLAEGIWRWTAPHPDWTPEKDRPGGWGRQVGCLYLEAPEGDACGVVLIDPLAPPAGSEEERRFFQALDRDVARSGRRVAILLGNHFHERHAAAFLERYRANPGASLWAPRPAVGWLRCEVSHAFLAKDPLPAGLIPHSICGLECPGETVFHDPAHRSILCADALIGVGGGRVRVPPLSWAERTPEGERRYKDHFRENLRPLADLDLDWILVSHGEPVLSRGRDALLEALEAPAWGDA